MNALLLQLVAHVSSVLLVLPAGWCNGLDNAQAGSASAKPTCCHRSQHSEPAPSQKIPLEPAARCCCDWDATLPEKSLPPDEVSSPALFAVADLSFSNAALPMRDKVLDFPRASGPPLHVLQCVWLC